MIFSINLLIFWSQKNELNQQTHRIFLPHRFIYNQHLQIQLNFNDFLYIEYSMSEQELINDELKHFQDIINEKITSIREILHEEDKAIVDQIVLKKSHSTDPIYPKYDKKICYYQEFWKVYLLNEIMISKIKDYSVSNKQLNKDVQTLDDAQKQWTQLWTQKSKKKIRRTSDMIQKVFDCPFEKCCRTYGSDVSLNLHMKLKHNSGTKTQRQALAKQICLAQEKGLKIKIDLNFPPGYLQQFRQNFRRQNV